MYFIPKEYDKTLKLLTLRKRSVLAAHEIVSEPDLFADFVKELQQNSKQKGDT